MGKLIYITLVLIFSGLTQAQQPEFELSPRQMRDFKVKSLQVRVDTCKADLQFPPNPIFEAWFDTSGQLTRSNFYAKDLVWEVSKSVYHRSDSVEVVVTTDSTLDGIDFMRSTEHRISVRETFHGREIQEEEQLLESPELFLRRKCAQYDQEGRILVEESEFESLFQAGLQVRRELYSYSKKGELLGKTVWASDEKGELKMISQSVFESKKRGKLLVETISTSSRSKSAPLQTQTVESEFDKDGRLVKKVESNPSQTFEYVYAENGIRLSETCFNGKGELIFRFVFVWEYW
ncbi:MAG: hypothetical protein H6581_09690 [Bacteroidia bacterium]|nr:hypothetical protein [Bacteroidia bacterium]